MFQWSKKEVKSVTFNPGVADESLLALVESHLEKNPNQSFSDLCKDALWQALCVPESVRPATKTTPPTSLPSSLPSSVGEPQFGDLHRQVADLEERFLLRESNRLDVMERQLMHLSQQLAQLAITVTQGITVQVASTQLASTGDVFITPSPPSPPTAIAPVEVDPVISRLSQLVDDF